MAREVIRIKNPQVWGSDGTGDIYMGRDNFYAASSDSLYAKLIVHNDYDVELVLTPKFKSGWYWQTRDDNGDEIPVKKRLIEWLDEPQPYEYRYELVDFGELQ